MGMILRQSKETSVALKLKFSATGRSQGLNTRFLLDLFCDAVYAAKVKSHIGNLSGNS